MNKKSWSTKILRPEKARSDTGLHALAPSRTDRASLSLFFAVIMAGLLLSNLIVLAGGKNMLLQSQVAVKLEQEAERLLSLFDADLYKQYGLWGMPENVSGFYREAQEVKVSYRETEGVEAYTVKLEEPLFKPLTLETQIHAFMKKRYPLVLAEQSLELLQQMQATTAGGELQELKQVLEKDRDQAKVAEFSSYLEAVREKGLEEDASQETLTAQVLQGLKEAAQEGLAAEIRLAEGETVDRIDAPSLLNLITSAQNLLNYETGSNYERLTLNEYALRMFPAQIHQKQLSRDYPVSESLRAIPLQRSSNKYDSLEYLLTGLEREKAEERVSDYLFLLRFLSRVSGILANQEKMSLYRNTAAILSLAVGVASGGKVSLPPETLTYSIVSIVGLKEAADDRAALLKGESVELLPYQKKWRLPVNYHDYLRLMLLAVPRENLLERLCQSFSEIYPSAHYTGLILSLNWQSPYFATMQEKFSLERRYAVYEEVHLRSD